MILARGAPNDRRHLDSKFPGRRRSAAGPVCTYYRSTTGAAGRFGADVAGNRTVCSGLLRTDRAHRLLCTCFHTVTTKAHSGTTATLTFTANHSIPVGATVTVALSPADSRFDGTFTVTAVTRYNYLVYKRGATVASTSSGGNCVTTADENDHIIAGTYHNGTGLGKLTYLGGHPYSHDDAVFNERGSTVFAGVL